jgi:hypothetical protein
MPCPPAQPTPQQSPSRPRCKCRSAADHAVNCLASMFCVSVRRIAFLTAVVKSL